MYSSVPPDPTDSTLDGVVLNAVRVTGLHNKVIHNTIHHCGWCVMSDFEDNAQGDFEFAFNVVSQQGHGLMVATQGLFSFDGLDFHDNQFTGTTAWDGAGCPHHQSSLHMFGVGASSIANNVRIYNNFYSGSWGTCPTGYIFEETGSSPIAVRTQYFFNNVAIQDGSQVELANGWWNISSATGFSTYVLNNSFIGNGRSDNGVPFILASATGTAGSLVFKDNLWHAVGNPIYIQANPTSLDSDFNIFDCRGLNCYVTPVGYAHNLAGYRAWCAGITHIGCDANSTQNSGARIINTDATLPGGSPAISTGTNLTSLATGVAAALAFDTTKGSTRTPTTRPGLGVWDKGAFNHP